MNAVEYRAALKTLGLSIVGAAPILGISRRQSQRYAAGETIPETVIRLLFMLQFHGIPEVWVS